MGAQVEFILITQESLEGELPQSWFYSQRQGPLVAANPSIIVYRLPPEEMLPSHPPPHPTTWKHSFYKPKAVLSQHDQLWAPSSQQCQRLWDWNTRFYKADLGRDPRASLQSLTRCCFPSIASHFLFILAFSSTKINKYFSYLLLFKAIYPFLLLYRLVF